MESVNPVPDGVPATTTPPPVASLATEGEGRGAGAEDPSSGGKKGNQGGRRMIITRARSRRSQEEVTVGKWRRGTCCMQLVKGRQGYTFIYFWLIACRPNSQRLKIVSQYSAHQITKEAKGLCFTHVPGRSGLSGITTWNGINSAVF